MSNIEWGPQVAVDGKRPEWLKDADLFQWVSRNRSWGDWDDDQSTSGGTYNPEAWFTLTYIRLPADHPHYQQAEATRIMQAAIAENGPPTKPVRTAAEMLDRLEALARRMAEDHKPGVHYVTQMEPLRDEARAIVAEMEPVVDGDLVEARKIVIEQSDSVNPRWIQAVESGNHDNDDEGVQLALAAIKRGRELERGA